MQRFFRQAVLNSYESRCALTGIAVADLLTASHIIPWSQSEPRRADPTNGLCLNALTAGFAFRPLKQGYRRHPEVCVLSAQAGPPRERAHSEQSELTLEQNRVRIRPCLASAAANRYAEVEGLAVMNGSDHLKPVFEGASIVIIGAFNPAIFQPFWLSRNNLIRDDEAKNANVVIVHESATIFQTEWFILKVGQPKFAAESEDPSMYLPLRDLVFGIFSILEHTPISSFGFNVNRHFELTSEQEVKGFDDFCAPKSLWDGIVEKPSLQSMTIEGIRPESGSKYTRIKVEPSGKVNHGLFLSINEHHVLEDDEGDHPEVRMREFLRTLETWDSFLSHADDVSNQLFSRFHKRVP